MRLFPFVARSTYELALTQIAEQSARISELEQEKREYVDTMLTNARLKPVTPAPEREKAAHGTFPTRLRAEQVGRRLELESAARAREKGRAN